MKLRPDDWTPDKLAKSVIAVGLIGMLAYLTWALVNLTVPTANRDAVGILLGILAAQIGVIIHAHYGRTAGEARKDETISTLAQTAQTAQSALAPLPAPTVQLGPGETATVKAENGPE